MFIYSDIMPYIFLNSRVRIELSILSIIYDYIAYIFIQLYSIYMLEQE